MSNNDEIQGKEEIHSVSETRPTAKLTRLEPPPFTLLPYKRLFFYVILESRRFIVLHAPNFRTLAIEGEEEIHGKEEIHGVP